MNADLISAPEACHLLGITAATLYSYVSRGLLESCPGPDHRTRMYQRRDVERLLRNKRTSRGAARGAAQSLDRGLPVLETGISLIQPDGPYYRGQSAIAAVRTGKSLEEIACLLWDCGKHNPFQHAPSAWPAHLADIALNTNLLPLERTLACIPLLALEVRHSFNLAAPIRHEIAALLLRQNAALLIAHQPSAAPVSQQLTDAWKPNHPDAATLISAALVLCADHELNVSAFAARVVASTGAHLHATVCSGLAALSGPRHGGATARAYALLIAGADEVTARWARGDDLPGFGHALYPQGDPRAAELLSMLQTSRAGDPRLAHLEALVARAEDVSGLRPNVDLLLAALCYVYDLPASAALVMFACGRLAGWLAHALEQQTLGKLIRPRAHYVGLPPSAVTSE